MNAAILGYGTVGSGVGEVLRVNHDVIAQRVGEELNVKYILDLREFPEDPFADRIVHDIDVIIGDESVRVVAEAMGGLEPAYTFTKRLLESGKSVCTSNKELVAAHGAELMQIAAAHGVNYLFEASCGGGIPIIRPLHQCLTGDVIDEVAGILNGTTNYMLTRMSQDGGEYSEVLKEAQEKGYAERNPEADVEGYDPCRKIAILSSIAFGGAVSYEAIHTEGITAITPEDFRYAKLLHCAIKLVASARREDGGVAAIVSPVLVSEQDPLYAVNDVFNAVFVHGNMLGDAMFYGKGAGKLPTASAVVGDLIDEARHLQDNVMAQWDTQPLHVLDYKEVPVRFFVRAKGSAKTELLEQLFGSSEVLHAEGLENEYGFVTAPMTEAEFEKQAGQLGELISRIRIREA